MINIMRNEPGFKTATAAKAAARCRNIQIFRKNKRNAAYFDILTCGSRMRGNGHGFQAALIFIATGIHFVHNHGQRHPFTGANAF